MTTLELGFQARKVLGAQPHHKVSILYRRVIREIPRILMIYDVVNWGVEDTKQKVRDLIYQHKDVKDPRIIQHLVNYGYYELEETMMQHKQKHHLRALLNGFVDVPHLSKRLPHEMMNQAEEITDIQYQLKD